MKLASSPRPLWLGVLAFLALLAPGLAVQQTGTITGTVVDSGSGQGIAGVQVYLPGLQLTGRLRTGSARASR